ncbi:MAG: SDR family oxidoreductase [Candidatus Sumerlaeia bacterium]
MKVLFIGGTGVISTAVSALAVEKGFELYLLNRGNRSQFAPEGAKSISCNINNEEEAAEVLKDYEFDVVVNWIVFTPDQIERDIRLFAGKCKQYIFISSASAYQKPLKNCHVTESTPLVNPHWQYSRNKIACEERLMQEHRENGFPFTIVRPSLTYGVTLIPAAFMSWNKPWTLVDRMRKGKKIIVHGDGTSLWTMTHNSDFAKGFVGLIGNMQAVGEAFHITSDEVLSWDDIYRTIGRAGGVDDIDIVHVPSDVLAAFSPGEEGNLTGDKAASAIMDNSKIKRFVPDFVATTSFAQGAKMAVDWYEEDPSRQEVDEDFNALSDKIIAAMEKLISEAKA